MFTTIRTLFDTNARLDRQATRGVLALPGFIDTATNLRMDALYDQLSAFTVDLDGRSVRVLTSLARSHNTLAFVSRGPNGVGMTLRFNTTTLQAQITQHAHHPAGHVHARLEQLLNDIGQTIAADRMRRQPLQAA